jgi:4-diphosphocytidyl-2-C-methyl-D-erythritol kinase
MERTVLSTAGKINLFLRVLSREIEGFHHVETLYQSVDLRDTLEIRRGGRRIDLEVEGIEVPGGRENLAVRAAEAYLEAAGIREGFRIRLRKEIPVGAGLGGGSADAAAVLVGLNVLCEERLQSPDLMRIAGSLGSDVPFMLRGGTAIGWARGNRLVTLSPLPAWPVLICVPDFQIGSGDAYHLLDDEGAAGEAPAVRYDPADFYSLKTLQSVAKNDFETVIFREHSVLQEIRDTFLQLGGQVALLTGTGSGVFTVFSSERERAGCLKAFEERFDERVFSTKLSMEGIQVEELE